MKTHYIPVLKNPDYIDEYGKTLDDQLKDFCTYMLESDMSSAENIMDFLRIANFLRNESNKYYSNFEQAFKEYTTDGQPGYRSTKIVEYTAN